MLRTVVIGDIHGCYDELMALLDRVGPGADDSIVALGDVVDRGPASEQVLSFLRDTPRASSILGNHESKHIRSARGEIRPALSQLIVRHQLGERYVDWLDFMAGFPRYLELPDAVLVHGYFEPGVPLAEQRDAVVTGSMSGQRYMRERFGEAWYHHYRGRRPLVCGHWDYLGNGRPLVHADRVYGLDTSVHRGGRLTALVLPDREIVQVPAREDSWSRLRREYGYLATDARSDLDLEWDTLAVYAVAAAREGVSAQHRQRARRAKTPRNLAQLPSAFGIAALWPEADT